MCDKDWLFCVFYYLGYVGVAGALFAGWFIFMDYFRSKTTQEEANT